MREIMARRKLASFLRENNMTGRLFRICGLVQGVGFRPYVWRLATELGLIGWVRNDGCGVIVTVGGEKVPEFIVRLPLGD